MYNLNEEFKKINEQIKPSKDFMRNLEQNLIKEVEKRNKKKDCFKKAVIAACSLFVFISGGVFAKDIGNLVSKMFSNINKGIEVAIENNYIQNVNMDYVECNGVLVKADYILIDDNNLSIAFNVKTDIEFDEIYFNEIYITDENGDNIYSSDNINEIIYDNDKEISNMMNIQDKLLSKKELMKTYTMQSILYKFAECENLHININEIIIMKNDSDENIIRGDWCFDISLDNDIFYRDNIEYAVQETDLLEEYNINLTNTELKIELKFKENLDLKTKISQKEKISLEDDEGNVYYCNDFNKVTDSELKVNFPITKFEYKDNLKLKINLGDETLIFNIKMNK